MNSPAVSLFSKVNFNISLLSAYRAESPIKSSKSLNTETTVRLRFVSSFPLGERASASTQILPNSRRQFPPAFQQTHPAHTGKDSFGLCLRERATRLVRTQFRRPTNRRYKRESNCLSFGLPQFTQRSGKFDFGGLFRSLIGMSTVISQYPLQCLQE